MKWSFFGPDVKIRYSVVIDIGSGSVGAAIVRSESNKKMPEMIWSYRESMAITGRFRRDRAAKSIIETTKKVFSELSKVGLRQLRDSDPESDVPEIQIGLSAPWCYTIVDKVSTSSDKPFKVTRKVLKELSNTAKKHADETLSDVVKANLVLEPITVTAVNLTANGYHVKDIVDKQVSDLSITIARGFADTELIKQIEDQADKILPRAKIVIRPFMLLYYAALNDLAPDTKEVCLIDITREATELALLRDGMIEHVTHNLFGTASLAREVAEITGVPMDEAAGYVRANGIDITKGLSNSKKTELESVIVAFEEKLAGLIKRAGGELSVPKTIYLLTDPLTSEFFVARLKNASKAATHCTHIVRPITNQLFTSDSTGDIALLLSAYVFHKNLRVASYQVE